MNESNKNTSHNYTDFIKTMFGYIKEANSNSLEKIKTEILNIKNNKQKLASLLAHKNSDNWDFLDLIALRNQWEEIFFSIQLQIRTYGFNIYTTKMDLFASVIAYPAQQDKELKAELKNKLKEFLKNENNLLAEKISVLTLIIFVETKDLINLFQEEIINIINQNIVVPFESLSFLENIVYILAQDKKKYPYLKFILDEFLTTKDQNKIVALIESIQASLGKDLFDQTVRNFFQYAWSDNKALQLDLKKIGIFSKKEQKTLRDKPKLLGIQNKTNSKGLSVLSGATQVSSEALFKKLFAYLNNVLPNEIETFKKEVFKLDQEKLKNLLMYKNAQGWDCLDLAILCDPSLEALRYFQQALLFQGVTTQKFFLIIAILGYQVKNQKEAEQKESKGIIEGFLNESQNSLQKKLLIFVLVILKGNEELFNLFWEKLCDDITKATSFSFSYRGLGFIEHVVYALSHNEETHQHLNFVLNKFLFIAQDNINVDKLIEIIKNIKLKLTADVYEQKIKNFFQKNFIAHSSLVQLALTEVDIIPKDTFKLASDILDDDDIDSIGRLFVAFKRNRHLSLIKPLAYLAFLVARNEEYVSNKIKLLKQHTIPQDWLLALKATAYDDHIIIIKNLFNLFIETTKQQNVQPWQAYGEYINNDINLEKFLETLSVNNDFNEITRVLICLFKTPGELSEAIEIIHKKNIKVLVKLPGHDQDIFEMALDESPLVAKQLLVQNLYDVTDCYKQTLITAAKNKNINEVATILSNEKLTEEQRFLGLISTILLLDVTDVFEQCLKSAVFKMVFDQKEKFFRLLIAAVNVGNFKLAELLVIYANTETNAGYLVNVAQSLFENISEEKNIKEFLLSKEVYFLRKTVTYHNPVLAYKIWPPKTPTESLPPASSDNKILSQIINIVRNVLIRKEKQYQQLLQNMQEAPSMAFRQVDGQSRAALYYLATYGLLAALEVAIEKLKSASEFVNLVTSYGKTPLDGAFECEQFSACLLLLRHGADFTLRTTADMFFDAIFATKNLDYIQPLLAICKGQSHKIGLLVKAEDLFIKEIFSANDTDYVRKLFSIFKENNLAIPLLIKVVSDVEIFTKMKGLIPNWIYEVSEKEVSVTEQLRILDGLFKHKDYAACLQLVKLHPALLTYTPKNNHNKNSRKKVVVGNSPSKFLIDQIIGSKDSELIKEAILCFIKPDNLNHLFNFLLKLAVQDQAVISNVVVTLKNISKDQCKCLLEKAEKGHGDKEKLEKLLGGIESKPVAKKAAVKQLKASPIPQKTNISTPTTQAKPLSLQQQMEEVFSKGEQQAIKEFLCQKYTALIADKNNFSGIGKYLDNFVQVAHRNGLLKTSVQESGEKISHFIARYGTVEQFKKIITTSNALLNSCNKKNETPLDIACHENNHEVVFHCLIIKASVNRSKFNDWIKKIASAADDQHMIRLIHIAREHSHIVFDENLISDAIVKKLLASEQISDWVPIIKNNKSDVMALRILQVIINKSGCNDPKWQGLKEVVSCKDEESFQILRSRLNEDGTLQVIQNNKQPKLDNKAVQVVQKPLQINSVTKAVVQLESAKQVPNQQPSQVLQEKPNNNVLEQPSSVKQPPAASNKKLPLTAPVQQITILKKSNNSTEAEPSKPLQNVPIAAPKKHPSFFEQPRQLPQQQSIVANNENPLDKAVKVLIKDQSILIRGLYKIWDVQKVITWLKNAKQELEELGKLKDKIADPHQEIVTAIKALDGEIKFYTEQTTSNYQDRIIRANIAAVLGGVQFDSKFSDGNRKYFLSFIYLSISCYHYLNNSSHENIRIALRFMADNLSRLKWFGEKNKEQAFVILEYLDLAMDCDDVVANAAIQSTQQVQQFHI